MTRAHAGAEKNTNIATGSNTDVRRRLLKYEIKNRVPIAPCSAKANCSKWFNAVNIKTDGEMFKSMRWHTFAGGGF